jgi:hypothetical protein
MRNLNHQKTEATESGASRGLSFCGWITFLAALLSFPPGTAAGQPQAVVEVRAASTLRATREQVVSAFLLNCLRFGAWPEAATPGPGRPARIGIVGEPGLEAPLQELARQAQARWFSAGAIELVVSTDPRRLQECQIVFLGRQRPANTSELLEELADKPIILVSEQPEFLEMGGCVELAIEHEKLNFNLNLDQMSARKLDLASKMKDLATSLLKSGKREANSRQRGAA